MHRTFSHNLVAHVRARFHNAVRKSLAIGAREVLLALTPTDCCVVLLATPIQRRAQPSFVRCRTIVAGPNTAILLATVHAQGALKVGKHLDGKRVVAAGIEAEVRIRIHVAGRRVLHVILAEELDLFARTSALSAVSGRTRLEADRLLYTSTRAHVLALA